MMRGGGKRVRYMALLDYKNKFGLLNEDYTHYSDRYNSQIRTYELGLRMNLDVDITSSTRMKFGLRSPPPLKLRNAIRRQACADSSPPSDPP